MGILSNRKFAIIVMVILIVASILLGSGRSLRNLVKEADTLFYNGAYGDGVGIAYDIESNLAIAHNMLTVSKRYLPEGNIVLTDLETDISNLESADTPAELLNGNQSLTQSILNGFNTLTAMELTNQDYDYCIRFASDVNENNWRMERDPYNETAKDLSIYNLIIWLVL